MLVDKINYAKLKKGGFMQQKQDNYFSMRLKSIGGHFTTQQLDIIKKTADTFGRGYVHLTSRQGIEIPFIHINDIDNVKKFLLNSGVEIGVCGPRIRTITACQGNAICSSGLIDTQKLANDLDIIYGGRDLPHKFKIGITGCHNNCLKAEENDIGIKGGVLPEWNIELCIYCGGCAKICPARAINIDRPNKMLSFNKDDCIYCGKCVKRCPTAISGDAGYIVSFGGCYGNRIMIGKNILPIIFDKDTLFKVIDETLNFFNDNAKRGERLITTIERIGWDSFEHEVLTRHESTINT